MRGEIIHMPEFWSEKLNVSRSEARRVIAQGGQRINREVNRSLDVPAQELRNVAALGTTGIALPEDGLK